MEGRTGRSHHLHHGAIILYGPPASGKNTVGDALRRHESRCVHFARLKAGRDIGPSYRSATAEDIGRLRYSDQILYENVRYGNVYLVDRPYLDSLVVSGRIPVLHLGQVAGVRAVRRYPARWLSVLLWCPRDVAEMRLLARGCTSVTERLVAWDETEEDIRTATFGDFDLRVDTHRVSPDEASACVLAALRGLPDPHTERSRP
jgi:guanylate kinase